MDVDLGGRCGRGVPPLPCPGIGRHMATHRPSVERPRNARTAPGRPRVSNQQDVGGESAALSSRKQYVAANAREKLRTRKAGAMRALGAVRAFVSFNATLDGTRM